MTAATEFDELVPDRLFRAELGGISAMTVWRNDHSPVAQAAGWPMPIRRGKRKFRSRRTLEKYKARLADAGEQASGNKMSAKNSTHRSPPALSDVQRAFLVALIRLADRRGQVTLPTVKADCDEVDRVLAALAAAGVEW